MATRRATAVSLKKTTRNESLLTRRYLIWCYKTTKENLDRIERKFTQLTVDDFILDELKKKNAQQQCLGQFDELYRYIHSKREDAFKQKYTDASSKTLTDDYNYLTLRFGAIEKAILRFLGKAALAEIESLYEKEMTRRILEAREEK